MPFTPLSKFDRDQYVAAILAVTRARGGLGAVVRALNDQVNPASDNFRALAQEIKHAKQHANKHKTSVSTALLPVYVDHFHSSTHVERALILAWGTETFYDPNSLFWTNAPNCVSELYHEYHHASDVELPSPATPAPPHRGSPMSPAPGQSIP